MSPTEILEKAATGLSEKFNVVAMLFTVFMLITLVVDIIGTKFFRWPVPGSIDFIGQFLMLVGAFGMAQAEILRKHIRVDFLVSRLPPRLQDLFKCISALLGFGVFVLLIVSCLQYSVRLYYSGEETFNLQWPLYPVPAILALTCFPVLVVFAWEFFRYLKGDRKK